MRTIRCRIFICGDRPQSKKLDRTDSVLTCARRCGTRNPGVRIVRVSFARHRRSVTGGNLCKSSQARLLYAVVDGDRGECRGCGPLPAAEFRFEAGVRRVRVGGVAASSSWLLAFGSWLIQGFEAVHPSGAESLS